MKSLTQTLTPTPTPTPTPTTSLTTPITLKKLNNNCNKTKSDSVINFLTQHRSCSSLLNESSIINRRFTEYSK